MSQADPSMPVKRPKFRPRRWLLAFLILIVATELGLRIVLGLGHPLLYQTDPACGYLPRPSQDIVRFFCRNTINQYGMRSPEFAMPRPKTTYRVLCLGDSVTYGTTFVTQDQIFTARLAVSLPDVIHSTVEVLNASAGGWAPSNEFGYLQSRGDFDANLVLWVWNTGDLSQPVCILHPSLSFPTENPWTAIGESWSRYAAPRLFHQPVPSDPGSTAAATQDAGQIARNFELLGQAKALAAQAGAAFALVYVCSPGADFQTPGYEAAHQQLIHWTADQAIPLLDLTDAFHANGWLALTFDGIHLRPQGDALVAREILTHWTSLTRSPASAQ